MSAANFAVDLLKDGEADVILGPVCTDRKVLFFS